MIHRGLPRAACGQRLVLFAAAVALALYSGTAARADFSRLGKLADDGFAISAEARLLDGSRETLGSIAPRQALSPASVTKTYTAAATLERFGPQHRFTTRLKSLAEAAPADGVLNADLWFEGGGDPGFTSEKLWRLVQRLHQAGVRRINGDVVVSQWRFGPVECATTDRCEARTRVDNAYSAPLSSAGVNFGSWCVNIAPGLAPGEPARVTHCDGPPSLVSVDNQVVTRPDDSDTRISAERVTTDHGDLMRVDGQISANAWPRDEYRGASNGAEQTADTLTAMLERFAIDVSGASRVTTAKPPDAAQTLAAVEGKPLQELILRTLNYSNNYMADVLALNLVETPGAELADAGRALESYAAGLPGHGEVTLESGSGLTTDNRTTAHGVNVMLESMYHQSSLFPSFVAALQSPENGVMRFIRRGPESFQHNVMLKTGTLNEPYAVRAMAGYFRTAGGRWGVFSVLINGDRSTPYLSWSKVLEPLSADLADMIDTH
ncbi:D-alanyl-D-alanine carboxypeptidase/D-alanyl-D-alanine-endopeptidase [Halomonas piscis]|uniref:D-alanyl-D-alanine carboxypeptidase/D-alanyl-D-alanine-endopeptidase n=1 Tax=Halomonas piscis TaxID=3031727 RepID=A0ABY9YYR0_9GAMM|nr:D-alanyl-D-alanine carboxypeptidase/D-alanyl-D-alanine-endopeptidase [Halomonas piscis]WNK19718.1 D-alanyl-D-alanine carboxypeptidase/D-alanyl-D-alanine-endopeptidase [Halomonas piscis]